MLLESSHDHGGSISFDVIGKMRTLVPSAKLYAWRERAAPFADGRVHAKVAVADGEMCFITSANLTGHAMERNMEAGVLIRGDSIAPLLHKHLQALRHAQHAVKGAKYDADALKTTAGDSVRLHVVYLRGTSK